jgi:hypothetical protein
METHRRCFAALRAFALVAVVTLAFVLLKTFSAWGVLVGFALLQVGLLISFVDRPGFEPTPRSRIYRRS